MHRPTIRSTVINLENKVYYFYVWAEHLWSFFLLQLRGKTFTLVCIINFLNKWKPGIRDAQCFTGKWLFGRCVGNELLDLWWKTTVSYLFWGNDNKEPQEDNFGWGRVTAWTGTPLSFWLLRVAAAETADKWWKFLYSLHPLLSSRFLRSRT